jgi:2-dehydro-3-deoxyphosphogluconate aldolase / (4S)-4-hydroxy-2-oxoglutarate aldolase
VADYFADALARVPVLAILRGLSAASAAAAAEQVWRAGIPLVEVSLSGEHAFASLEAVCRRGREIGGAAGAGTVLTPDDVAAAEDAGAAFAVAPGLDPDTVAAAQAHGLPYMPGVATPSEIQLAVALGCQTLKLFPASVLGIEWLRSLTGPFPTVRFVAVGGVDVRNASDWMDAGALGVGVGSALAGPALPELVAAVAR